MSSIHTNPTSTPRQTPRKKSRPLGQLLIDRGALTNQQLDEALKYQKEVAPGKLLGQILLEKQIVPPEHLVEVMAQSLDIPYVVATASMVEPDALAALPEKFLDRHNLLPLSLRGGWLTIAVEHFTDVFLLEDISRRSGCQIKVVAATGVNIRETREAVLNLEPGSTAPAGEGEEPHGESLEGILDQFGMDEMTVVEQEERENVAELEAAATGSPVVKLVNQIVHNAVDLGASDIHIEPDESVFRVRYRVDGELMEAVRPSRGLLPAVVSRIKIMSGMDISERRIPQDGGVTVMLGRRPIDLRVSTMATKLGEKVVMRVVDRDSGVRGLEAMGFEPDMLARFRAVVRESYGMVLVTGPTGSGKTTTLYGAISEIVSGKHNISTVEDPIERRLAGTNQFQVDNAAGFTFARALRALLRQDPDIIMVGEIRDRETASLATEAALTGHLVLSTLHTNDAPTAVPRLVNMGVEPYLLAASLRGVLAQRLVRRICSYCRREAEPSTAVRDLLTQLCGGTCPVEVIYEGAGCPRCRGTGYSGRVGIFELLLLNEELLSSIVRDGNTRSIRDRARRQGFTTLLEDGLAHVRRGAITVEGLLGVVSRTDHLVSTPAPVDDATTD